MQGIVSAIICLVMRQLDIIEHRQRIYVLFPINTGAPLQEEKNLLRYRFAGHECPMQGVAYRCHDDFRREYKNDYA